MTNRISKIKNLIIVFFICLSLTACISSVIGEEDDSQKEKIEVRFSIAGITDGTEEEIEFQLRSYGSINKELFEKTDEGLMIRTTLMPDTAWSKTRASQTMVSGTKYRVIAYQGGIMKGQAVGEAQISEASMALNAGSYDIVAYSYNNTTLPAHSESLELTVNDDFLWVNVGSVSITSNNTTNISLLFKHMRSMVRVVADASVLVEYAAYASMYNVGENVTAVTASLPGITQSPTTITLQNGHMTASGTPVSPTLIWQDLNTKKAYADVYFYPTGISTPTTINYSSITFGRPLGTPGGTTTFNPNIKSFTGKTMVAGTRYILRSKFHKLCGAFVASVGSNNSAWKEFQCYNLGATIISNMDPFSAIREAHGNYYAWGVKNPVANTYPNDALTHSWIGEYAPNNALLDNSKTLNDPCPDNWRIPTVAQWGNVIAHNIASDVGSFDADSWTSGKFVGDNLFLPSAGYRDTGSGSLLYRGLGGAYWSSSMDGNYRAYSLQLGQSVIHTIGNSNRNNGFSVRCIRE